MDSVLVLLLAGLAVLLLANLAFAGALVWLAARVRQAVGGMRLQAGSPGEPLTSSSSTSQDDELALAREALAALEQPFVGRDRSRAANDPLYKPRRKCRPCLALKSFFFPRA